MSKEGDGNSNVVNIDDHRVRYPLAYFEAVWGESEFGWNAKIVDIESLRRNVPLQNLTMRPPETSYEVELIIRHLRAAANDIAKGHRLNHLVKPEDDI